MFHIKAKRKTQPQGEIDGERVTGGKKKNSRGKRRAETKKKENQTRLGKSRL